MGDGERRIAEPGQSAFRIEALETKTAPPPSSGTRAAANRPAVWKSGMSHRNTLLRPTWLPSTKLMQPKKALDSVRITPVGRPDVPDV